MKILLMLFAGPYSGIAQYSYELSKPLAQHADKTVLVLNNHFHYDSFHNLKIYKPFNRTRTILFDIAKVFRYIHKQRPDIVHLQNYIKNPFFTLLIIYICKFLRTKIIFTAHDIRPHYEKPWDIFFLKKMYTAVNGVIVHSSNNKETLLKISDCKLKTTIIPHGIYKFYNNNNAITREKARNYLGLPLSKKVIVYFGKIDKRKGADKLILQIPRLLEKDKNILLVLSGNNNFRRGYIQDIIKKRGLNNNIILFDKWIPEEEVKYYFLSANAIILPYIEGSTSGVLKIAMAFNKKIISTHVGELPEQLRHYSKGLLVHMPFSQGDIYNIINFIDKNNYTNGNDVLADQLSWEIIANSTFLFYKQIITSDENNS